MARRDEVGIDIVARDMATKAFQDVGRSVGGLQGQLQGASQALRTAGSSMRSAGTQATVGLTLPIVGLGTAIFNTGKNFEATMDQIVGLVGVSRDQVNAWKPEILDLSRVTGIGAQELGEALFFVTSAGLEGADAMDALEASARASAAGLGDTSAIADALTSVMNAYGPGVYTAAEATDILIATVREGKLSASELPGILGPLIPMAETLGVGFEEVGGALAAMTRVSGDVVGSSTQLNAFFSAIVKMTPAAEAALEDFGLSAADLRAHLDEKGLQSTIALLNDKLGDNEEAWAAIFPNVRALRGLLNLTGQDGEAVAGVFEGVADSAGSLDAAFGAVESGSGMAFDRAMAEIGATMITLADDIMPVVSDLLRDVTGFIGGMTKAWQELSPETRKFIILAAGVAAVIGPVLIGLGFMVSGLGVLLGLVAAIASPIGLLVLGIGALAFMLKDQLAPAIEPIIDLFGLFAQFVGAVIGALQDGEDIGGVLDVINEFSNNFGEAFAAIWAGIQEAIPLVMEAVGELIGAIINWVIESGIPMLIEMVQTLIPIFIDWVAETIPQLLVALGDLFAAVVGWLGENLDDIIAKLVEYGIAFAGWVATEAIPRLLQALPGIIGTLLGFLVSSSITLGLAFIDFAGGLVEKFIGALMALPGKVVEVIMTIIRNGPQIAADLAAAALKMGQDLVGGFINGLGGLPGKLLNAIKNAFRSIKFTIGPFTVSASGISINLPKIELPSFDVGSWRIPNDMIAAIHKDEMIIPADIAKRLRGEGGSGIGALGKTPAITRGRGGGEVTINIVNNYGAGSVRSDEDIRRISREQAERARLLGYAVSGPGARAGLGAQ